MTTFSARCPLICSVLLLSACTSGPWYPGDDDRLQQLAQDMSQCRASQQRVVAQLQAQQAALEQQQQQLAALVTGLESTAPTASDDDLEAARQDIACAGLPAKLTVGELEQVWLKDVQLALPARIDTGAETASLDARNIEIFERDGRRWVRFEIVHPETGNAVALERRLRRMVQILQASASEPERRPVVKLGITIGHLSQTAEFTLSNRSHLDYQMLIGRNVLRDVMIVDVSRQNIAPYAASGEGTAGTLP